MPRKVPAACGTTETISKNITETPQNSAQTRLAAGHFARKDRLPSAKNSLLFININY